jgi:hypothetical protein
MVRPGQLCCACGVRVCMSGTPQAALDKACLLHPLCPVLSRPCGSGATDCDACLCLDCEQEPWATPPMRAGAMMTPCADSVRAEDQDLPPADCITHVVSQRCPEALRGCRE